MTTTDTERISDFVLGAIRDMLNMPLPDTTSPDTPLGAGGLELESLSYVELSVHIEREFGIQFSDEAVDGFATATLGELVSDIRTRTAEADADTGTGTPGPSAESAAAAPAGVPSLFDVKRLLALSQIIPVADPESIADDEPVVLDSLTLVWFQYQLNEQHGIELDIDHAAVEELTSVTAIHAHLRDALTAPTEAVGR
ncbi:MULTISPECIES: acyl carrier protein [unclassified Streptomyces]|uniref:acyl carrier protein n=1 Tax=unclassified Streptomyces TaxID=2593676 RepID=UPI001587AFB0|nr:MULTISPECIES: acyl carrier protein [unclassified Streptomyces]NUV71821.1 acyl carrier protein [Streptomyces sp. CAI-121]NUW03765.1 acyl carrier protein [Streptomyces sp. CAI 127]NUW17992.1 acyl carrier protein [Streptomyces sp. CAI-68]